MAIVTLPRPEGQPFYEWTGARLAERLEAGEGALGAVNADAWLEERARRRAMLARVLVPDWPIPDPQVTVTDAIDHAAFRILKLRFQSLPDYWVTALLYVPHDAKPGTPGMIVASGHILEAKAFSEYHGISVELARQGMVVLAFDPVGQGERVQNWDHMRNRFNVGWGTTEHDVLGNQALLCGWPLAQAFAWDGMRAIDVLLARPEVDPARVGVCGISGGGTQTTWLLAADDRLAAAAPACFITGWREQFAARVGADPEQYPFPANAWGWDEADILASFAPKPLLLVAVTRDFFPIEGTRKTYARLRDLYRRLGVEDRAGMFEADFDHSYYPPLREATVRWFCGLFGIPYDGKDAAQDILPPEKLRVTPTGQLITSGFPRTFYDHIHGTRPSPLGAQIGEVALAHRERWQQRRRQTLRELLALAPAAPTQVQARQVDAIALPEGTAEQWLIETEPGVELPALVARPKGGIRGVVLHLHELGTDTDWGLAGGPVYGLLRAGWAVASVDPRGTGAGRGDTDDERQRRRFGAEAHASWTWTMLDRPLIGQRVFDVLQAAAWVYRLPAHAGRTTSDGRPGFEGLPVAIIGVGEGAIWALFAAALDTRMEQVVTFGGLSDYARILNAANCAWHTSALVPRMFTWGDLPQVAALVAPRPLTIIAPVDHDRRPVSSASARSTYRGVARLYEAFAAPTFHIVAAGRAPEDVPPDYCEWLCSRA